MSTIFALPDNIKQEFSLDESGKAYASQRATARLAGVSQEAVRKLLLKLSDNQEGPKILKSFIGYSFLGDNLPDVLVASIIEYYAFEAGRYCTKQAKLVFRAFATVGFRVWAQKQLGWKEQPATPTLSLEDTITLANFAASSAQSAGVSVALAESIKLDSVMQIKPEAKPLLLPQKNAIANANPLPEKALSPTQIAEKLTQRLGITKISARAVNKKLLELDFQVSIKRVRKSTGKEVHDYYKATAKGEKYSKLEMATYKISDGNSTKYQLRWFSKIVDILVNYW